MVKTESPYLLLGGWGIVPSLPFGYGVVATPRKGIAAQNAPKRKKEPNDEAPFLEGFDGILRTGGLKPATGRLQGRDEFLIESDKINADISHTLTAFTPFPQKALISLRQKADRKRYPCSLPSLRRHAP